jgi:tRNA (guanine10-N2)-methyltransferase
MSCNDNRSTVGTEEGTTATTKHLGTLLPQDRYNVLVEFAHKHLDFQLAELESVLDLYGILLHQDQGCLVIPLPATDATHSSSGNGKRKEEIDVPRSFAILSFPSSSSDWLQLFTPCHGDNVDNKTSISTPGSRPNLVQILHRCTLIRSAMELWGMGQTLEECAANTKTWVHSSPLGKSCWDQACGGDDRSSGKASTALRIDDNQGIYENLPSWKITVHTLGSKYSRSEQDAMRRQFAFLDFPGPVRMEDPMYEFVLIREIELDSQGSPLYPRHSHLQDTNGGKILIPENEARSPLACYFGRVLGGTRTFKGRGGVEQYSLKKRAYLGPTSMDAELSFIMTNLGQVQRGSFCFDPFVGTGSILLSCAIRGAYCFGSDIDIRVLRGMNKENNVFSNFEQFQLPRPDLIRSDNAIYHRHFRKHLPMYDAIICDPPYGIRAGARKSGSRLENPKPVDEEQRHDHIAQTKPYAVSDVMSDLLDMAARTLVMNGRLVYVIPSFADFDVSNDLPQHGCLQLVHTCFQPLSLELGRRIVTMRKIKGYDQAQQETYLAAIWKNGPDSAEKCVNLRDKINEAAKKKPGYAEKLHFRKQKRKVHKEVKKRAKLGQDGPLSQYHNQEDRIDVVAPLSETEITEDNSSALKTNLR